MTVRLGPKVGFAAIDQFDSVAVAYSPSGAKIVSGSDDKTIKVWDAGAFWALKHQFFGLS